MRIGIDARDIYNPSTGAVSGVPQYVRGITTALLRQGGDHSLVLFLPVNLHAAVREELEQAGRFEEGVLPTISLPLVTRHMLSPIWMHRHRIDVLFAPGGQLPLGWRGRSIVSAHDFAIYRHPEWFPDSGLGRTFSTRAVVPRSLRIAERIVAVSEATKHDLIELFRLPESKIDVVPPAVELPVVHLPLSDARRSSLGIRGRYFLTLGTIEPRKNLTFVVRAFSAWQKRTGEEVQLVLCGKRGWSFADVLEEIDLANRNGMRVIETGPVSNDEKWSLLAGAVALIHPSHDEGFGIPILEAMTAGVPVVTARRGAQPEVAQEAAMYVEPTGVESLERALNELATSPEVRERLIALGRERALSFSWGKSAQQILDRI